MKRRLATLVLLASTTPLAAQWLTLPTPGIPRMADGGPDLSAPTPRFAGGLPDLTGLWVPTEVSGDLLDPAKVQAWARALITERERRFFEDDPRFQCLPSGPGYLTAGGLRRIVQNPTVIVILYADLAYRQIFMDGRELEPDPYPTWTGYSVGRWDGDTLVVESNGFNDKTWLHRGGLSHTENLRITERYRRLAFGHMQVEVTYEDPGVFDSPLHAVIEMEFMADDELLDVLDADDLHVVGRKTREDVHRDHDWHGTVFVWSAWESADVRLMLLQQRGRVGDPYAQMVDALAGGHIGAGETAIDGARRELTEEVGLAAEADNFIHRGSSRMERPDGECRRVYQSLLLYPLPLDIGGMQFSDEVDGFVEVDLDGFSDLVHGRCEHLPARARLAHDGGHLRQIDLQRRAVLGYPDEIVDTFRRSLASISSWLRHGAVDSVHFE